MWEISSFRGSISHVQSYALIRHSTVDGESHGHSSTAKQSDALYDKDSGTIIMKFLTVFMVKMMTNVLIQKILILMAMG